MSYATQQSGAIKLFERNFKVLLDEEFKDLVGKKKSDNMKDIANEKLEELAKRILKFMKLKEKGREKEFPYLLDNN